MCSLPVNSTRPYSAIQPDSSPLPQDSGRAKSAPLYLPLYSESSSAPFQEVTYQIWGGTNSKLADTKIWFNFFLESHEKMEQFMKVAAQNEIDAVRLIRTIDMDSETNSEKEDWCVRFMTPANSMATPLAAILEAYPNLHDYLVPVVLKINEVLKKNLVSV